MNKMVLLESNEFQGMVSCIDRLLPDLQKQILGLIDPLSLGRVCQVNKNWYSLSTSVSLWEEIYRHWCAKQSQIGKIIVDFEKERLKYLEWKQIENEESDLYLYWKDLYLVSYCASGYCYIPLDRQNYLNRKITKPLLPNNTSFLINLCLLGAGGIGKSNIVNRFISNSYYPNYDPTTEDSFRKQIQIEENFIMLDIYDTAGSAEYCIVQRSSIKLHDMFLLCYSTTSKISFFEAIKYMEKVKFIRDPKSPGLFILVGNKCDLVAQREVSRKEALDFAKSNNIPFLETSALNVINVEELFTICAKETLYLSSMDSISFKDEQPKHPSKCLTQ